MCDEQTSKLLSLVKTELRELLLSDEFLAAFSKAYWDQPIDFATAEMHEIKEGDDDKPS